MRLMGILLLMLVRCFEITVAYGDILGCPCRGCDPSGSFTLGSALPNSSAQVQWSTMVERLPNDHQLRLGCTSDDISIVCPTKTGYVSLDPFSGKIKWNVTTKSSPYHPILNGFGDVIGSDANYMWYISEDGHIDVSLNFTDFKPAYGLVNTSNYLFVVTSTNVKTSQVVTFDGYKDFPQRNQRRLNDSLLDVSGTFIVHGQPITHGFRAFFMTRFLPDDMSTPEAVKVLGFQRLYALDLYNGPYGEAQLAWYVNITEDSELSSYSKRNVEFILENGKNIDNQSWRKLFDSQNPPILSYFAFTVFVNNPEVSNGHKNKDHSSKKILRESTASTLWAIADTGGYFFFKRPSNYGPMAGYTNEELWGEDSSFIWVVNASSCMITGYDSLNGSVVVPINVTEVADLPSSSWISSQLSVTRQNSSLAQDVLVVGVIDDKFQPHLVAIEAGEDPAKDKAKLLWSIPLGANSTTDLFSENSNNSSDDEGFFYTIDGQIIDYIHQNETINAIIAMVVARNDTDAKVFVKGIF